MKYLLILLIFTGCMTPKKAVDVLSRPKNEPTAAEFCATKYPVKDSIIKGDSVIRFDTLWGLVTDTLISEPQVIIETKIVPKTVTKTITIRDTIVRENTAKVSVLNSQIAKLEANNRQQTELAAKYLQERDEWRFNARLNKAINWLLIAVLLYLGWRKIRNKFKIF